LGFQITLPEEKRNYFNIERKERIEYVRHNISEIIKYIESRIRTENSLFLPTENKAYGHRGILIPITGPLIYNLADNTTLELLRGLRKKEDYDNAFNTLFINKSK